ncbi:hypothetical protein RND81_06G220500 [Saponaria officinalis]|uniref:DRBM domain-containing protein n=1 Tax=Saponaria officinalis TaxID=3572 RepID=A0AAW1KFH8_SAPOF
MEATQANVSSGYVNYKASVGLNNPFTETSASVHPTVAPRFESYHGLIAAYPQNTWPGNASDNQFESYRGVMAAYPQNMRPGNASDNQFQNSVEHRGSGCPSRVQAPAPSAGVSNCYVFKSRLQEYAQRVGLSTPTYETIREGPSHEPSFRSTVIVGGARYDSLLGFFNRKAAEQSAAEVALMALSTFGDKKESITVPVHETGLCKNVLQEYAQKMNYAIPTYVCNRGGSSGRYPLYSCTVDIGGIQYIGAVARTKKEAEIKAARTALLAIRSSGNDGGELGRKTNHTVLPCKRKLPETAPAPSQEETSKPKKSKKPRFKKPRKHMHPGFSGDQIQAMNMAMYGISNMGAPVTYPNFQVVGNGQNAHYLENSAQVNGATNVIARTGAPSGGDSAVPITDTNSYNGATDISPMINASISSQLDTLLPDTGVDQRGEAPIITDPNNGKEGNNIQTSAWLGAVELDSKIGDGNSPHGLADADPEVERGEAPTMTDTTHAKEGNNTQSSEHHGAVKLDSNIGDGNSAHGLTNADFEVDQRGDAPTMTDTNISKEVNNTQASEELGGVKSDTKIGDGNSAHCLADAEVVLRGEAPINHAKNGNDNQASEQLGAVKSDSKIGDRNSFHVPANVDSEVDQREEAPTMTDTNNATEGNNDNDVGAIVPSVNSQASEQLDAVY